VNPLKWTQPFGIRKLLVVPLVTHDRAIGLVAIDHSDASREFSPDQIDLALTIGGQVASAIANARLYAQAERRTDQLRALREASRALTSDLRLETVLQTLVETARQLTRARYAALAVLGADGQVAQFHVKGVTAEEQQRIGAPPQGRGLLGALLRGGIPIRLTDLARDPRSVGFPPHHPAMKTFMGVPIVARGKVVGSLYLTDKTDDEPFSQTDEDLVVGLAADAASAIENAKLFGQVQQLAITDEVTGLHNRRHLLELAEREFERARRYGHPLSAIMLDIDHFKQVNDTFGHAVGDEVLRGVAVRCQKNLREIDLLGRYGGEEFLVLLPENDPEGTRNAAERLRLCVADAAMDTSRGPVAVTISLGIAVSSGDCPNLTTLINRADMAMYAAKAAGRDRVAQA
jgi:diguanylate cyclase (GGDEF)-like protein